MKQRQQQRDSVLVMADSRRGHDDNSEGDSTRPKTQPDNASAQDFPDSPTAASGDDDEA